MANEKIIPPPRKGAVIGTTDPTGKEPSIILIKTGTVKLGRTSNIDTSGNSPKSTRSLIFEEFIVPPLAGGYLYARMSVSQTSSLSVGNHVEFDLSASTSDTIFLAASGSGQQNGIFQLAGGRVYEIHTQIRANVNEGVVNLSLFDEATGIQMRDVTGDYCPETITSDNGATDAAEMTGFATIINPDADTSISLTVTSGTLQFEFKTDTQILIKDIT